VFTEEYENMRETKNGEERAVKLMKDQLSYYVCYRFLLLTSKNATMHLGPVAPAVRK